jgi:hypothetical protein
VNYSSKAEKEEEEEEEEKVISLTFELECNVSPSGTSGVAGVWLFCVH